MCSSNKKYSSVFEAVQVIQIFRKGTVRGNRIPIYDCNVLMMNEIFENYNCFALILSKITLELEESAKRRIEPCVRL